MHEESRRQNRRTLSHKSQDTNPESRRHDLCRELSRSAFATLCRKVGVMEFKLNRAWPMEYMLGVIRMHHHVGLRCVCEKYSSQYSALFMSEYNKERKANSC